MTRSELQVLSRAHAVAYAALAAQETRAVPMAEALALRAAAAADLPDFVPVCGLFIQALRDCHGKLDRVVLAGRNFRDAVICALSFRPVDAARVDIHG